jgi:hypothetical protein
MLYDTEPNYARAAEAVAAAGGEKRMPSETDIILTLIVDAADWDYERTDK